MQIDFGCLISGEEDKIVIGNIEANLYKSSIDKASLFIRAPEKRLNENADNLQDLILNAYPQGCILKVGGGVGHYCYYDVQKISCFLAEPPPKRKVYPAWRCGILLPSSSIAQMPIEKKR
ncbi:hypothetical protein GTU79_01800 [Sodalis ligni]|uniref:hypothetical protein n=1 Tax=Sodalis ligni TaxID=2697027 RepID=UPI001BDEF3C9|nr:hypothetical protein [Sodalis ligni]QWA11581.1 hypothetical protein GTU79_01800 [Sodalis ligni]